MHASFRWAWFVPSVAALGLCAWALGPSLPRAPQPAPQSVGRAPMLSSGQAPPSVHFKLRRGAAVQAMPDALRGYAITALFDRPSAVIDADRAEALANTGTEAPDLRAWHRVIAATPAEAEGLAVRLSADPTVEAAFVAPHVEPASIHPLQGDPSCPLETPSYSPLQGYLGPAPAGVDAPAAWNLPGGRGAGVSVADIEGAWNFTHEDIPGDRMQHVGGSSIRDRHWEAHGTAVVGVIAARDNGLGMTGIAPDVDRVLVSAIGDIGPAAAIDRAQAALEPGDVLLIELHGIGPRGRFVPMEYWDDVYDAIRLATDRGVIVVEAAGNGGENLDHRVYRRVFDRTKRDSGAIMVGAGAPPRPGFTDRSRLYFSNYGGRVDVQGWGFKVATFDYGDLQDCSDPERNHDRIYTGEFSGTSSASPIVVGAAALLQGIYKARTGGEVLSPRAMRDLLWATGTPQTDGPEGRAAKQPIGPRPDLARAIERL